MLRKLVIWLLLIPLPLNGLWMVCRDAPSTAPESAPTIAGPEENLFTEFADTEDGDATLVSTTASQTRSSDCDKICAFRTASKTGSFCFFSDGGAKTSITIIVFGLPLIPLATAMLPLDKAGHFTAEMRDNYLDPHLFRFTPPPRV